jgi:hypothetical protein
MRKKIIIYFFLLLSFIFFPIDRAFAVENPLAVANNKIGIHILDQSELNEAAKLVNSNGGDWGYVTIPIQAGDRDLVKWQSFMDNCKRLHLIPLVRLATEGDYFNTAVWRKPNEADIADFANFLDSLDWPTKNRYIIVFNEVNRGDEWGGSVSPDEYAELLSFAVTVFKSKSSDFFIICAGLDNAAPDQGSQYMNEYNYLRQMNNAVPGIFHQIDGMSSHSYPNPGFSQPPTSTNITGVNSFAFERNLISTLSRKLLPVFITETGWAADSTSEEVRLSYYDKALKTIWNDSNIVAITPFLLQAGAGPFEKFSFLTAQGAITKQYSFFHNLSKIKGVPSFPTHVLAAETKRMDQDRHYPIKDFREYKQEKRSFSMSHMVENIFNYLIVR